MKMEVRHDSFRNDARWRARLECASRNYCERQVDGMLVGHICRWSCFETTHSTYVVFIDCLEQKIITKGKFNYDCAYANSKINMVQVFSLLFIQGFGVIGVLYCIVHCIGYLVSC